MSKAGWGFFVLALGAGCVPSLADNPSRDAKRELPATFVMPGTSDGGVPEPTATSAAQQHWTALFASQELRGLIELALKNNQELNVRVQEIVIAEAEVGARRGEYLPKLGLGVGAGMDKVGATTSQGVSDEAHEVPAYLGDFGFGLRASWEVDVWGRLRNAAGAARARALASVEGRNFMVTQLVAELARSYFELVALDAQLEVLERNIGIQADALQVVRMEKQAARVTELAVQRFEAEVLKNKSRLYDLRQERVQAENRINFLVGRFPQPVARDAASLKAPLPAVLQAGVPAQLLENRPDLRQAELELEASKLDVDVARKRFYPALSIDAAVGYRSFNVTHLVDTPASLALNVAGNIVAPLLNRAGIEADYRTANAKQLQAVYKYEQTLLQAFTDVANQLVKFENLQQGYGLQEQQVATLDRAVEVSNVLFQSARADYMEVLLTRRDSLESQMELIETKKRVLHSMVNLYQALGGGWRSEKAEAPAP